MVEWLHENVMYLMPLNFTLKNGSNGKFYVYFPQLQKHHWTTQISLIYFRFIESEVGILNLGIFKSYPGEFDAKWFGNHCFRI